jgi:hypothetical protein
MHEDHVSKIQSASKIPATGTEIINPFLLLLYKSQSLLESNEFISSLLHLLFATIYPLSFIVLISIIDLSPSLFPASVKSSSDIPSVMGSLTVT